MSNFEKLKTVYDIVGGDEFFNNLVDIFYSKVAKDELLNGMFVDQTFVSPKRHLYLFLRMLFGGPDDYTPERGHPKMRRRHFPFKIGVKERNRWLKLMLSSLDELGVTSEHQSRAYIQEYFERVATHMINQEIKPEDFIE